MSKNKSIKSKATQPFIKLSTIDFVSPIKPYKDGKAFLRQLAQLPLGIFYLFFGLAKTVGLGLYGLFIFPLYALLLSKQQAKNAFSNLIGEFISSLGTLLRGLILSVSAIPAFFLMVIPRLISTALNSKKGVQHQYQPLPTDLKPKETPTPQSTSQQQSPHDNHEPQIASDQSREDTLSDEEPPLSIIESMPNEVLIHLSQYLTEPQDTIRLSHASRRFYHFFPKDNIEQTRLRAAHQVRDHLISRDFKSAKVLLDRHPSLYDVQCEYRANAIFPRCTKQMMTPDEYLFSISDAPGIHALNSYSRLTQAIFEKYGPAQRKLEQNLTKFSQLINQRPLPLNNNAKELWQLWDQFPTWVLCCTNTPNRGGLDSWNKVWQFASQNNLPYDKNHTEIYYNERAWFPTLVQRWKNADCILSDQTKHLSLDEAMSLYERTTAAPLSY